MVGAELSVELLLVLADKGSGRRSKTLPTPSQTRRGGESQLAAELAWLLRCTRQTFLSKEKKNSVSAGDCNYHLELRTCAKNYSSGGRVGGGGRNNQGNQNGKTRTKAPGWEFACLYRQYERSDILLASEVGPMETPSLLQRCHLNK